MLLPLMWQLTSNAQVLFTGKILGGDGKPIVGAHIYLGEEATATDVDGAFALRISNDGKFALRVNAIGYLTLRDSILLQGDTDRELVLEEQSYDLDLIELTSSWVKPDQPFTYQQVNAEELQDGNYGRDVPYLLQSMPSTVVTSDAGTGIGYTGIRIRGSDPSRINVTLDGVPVNDAESQGVFWVDLPDLAGSAGSIQVQRGVGTSTNGAGAFGGTINVKTSGLEQKAYAGIDLTAGSFNTTRANAKFGSGIMKEHFSLQGSLSKIDSDGYIDRASSDLYSVYLSGVYLDDKQSLKVNFLRGKEVTYQAWNGVPAQLINDPVLRTFNTAGAIGDGTYHPDEVDDYGQTHLHLIYQRQVNSKIHLQTTLHYTKGEGYFEQYRPDEQLESYGLGQGDQSSDLIRRRWLDNDFYGLIFSLKSRPTDTRSEWTIGGGMNQYLGGHFGQAVWTKAAGEIPAAEYYRNDATKNDLNLFAQYQYRLPADILLFADLQWRNLNYAFEGLNSDLTISDQQVNSNFFNPKVGVSRTVGKLHSYYSFAIGHREPNRDDYVESSIMSRPKAERLLDHELGIRYTGQHATFGLNYFYMKYRDQLVLTGAINDVGEYTRVNVPHSFRTGIEATLDWEVNEILRLSGNATWNKSRLKSITEAIDDWDTGGQEQVLHENVPISFSPEWVYFLAVDCKILETKRTLLQGQISHKFVGSQYLDNSGSKHASLDSYSQTDVNLRFSWDADWCKKVTIKCQVANLFDQLFVSNGWVYRYISKGYDATPDELHTTREKGDQYTQIGYYPQAGIHALFGLGITF